MLFLIKIFFLRFYSKYMFVFKGSILQKRIFFQKFSFYQCHFPDLRICLNKYKKLGKFHSSYSTWESFTFYLLVGKLSQLSQFGKLSLGNFHLGNFHLGNFRSAKRADVSKRNHEVLFCFIL